MNVQEALNRDAAIVLHSAIRRRGFGPDVHWQAADADHVMWCKAVVKQGTELDLHWELRRRGLVADEHLVRNGNADFADWVDDLTERIQKRLGVWVCEECAGTGDAPCECALKGGDASKCETCKGRGVVACECAKSEEGAAA